MNAERGDDVELENSAAFLIECIHNTDFKTWNNGRKKKKYEVLVFENQNFSGLSIERFNLQNIHFVHCDLQSSIFNLCPMNHTQFRNTNFYASKFEECDLVSAIFENSTFSMASFEACNLKYSHFIHCQLHQLDMNACLLSDSIFEDSSIVDSSLTGADFSSADLRGTQITQTDLSGSNFTRAYVDGKTLIWDCYYDRITNFTGVGLSSSRVEPALSSSFACNIRRIWWHNWYKEQRSLGDAYWQKFKEKPLSNLTAPFYYALRRLLILIVVAFWWITDYGSSTLRLLLVFGFNIVSFSILYSIFPILTNDPFIGSDAAFILKFAKSIYFSIIVMTSVGFGDVHASDQLYSLILVSFQALTGYILLGAFLVRIGILFQGEFPVAPVRKRPNRS